jgi:anti-sigma28 factor (negative regulator of flagellin synthesis)
MEELFMAIEALSSATTTAATTKTTYEKTTQSGTEKAAESTSSSSTISDLAAVYEKSSDSDGTVTKTTSNAAIVAKLKADAEERTAQLKSIVEKLISKQGQTIGTADDDMWKFLAKGDFEVDAETKAQAQADIADDGYWGVEQTSDRILDFAKALAGDDADKADELLEAFKKGFEEATKSWGDDLPDISQRTYDAVVKKFEAWKNGTEDETEE